ncbi:MAG: hypothetical protein HY934_04150, partial [Candidatus Firestonebacteria bacterium]|nr:hypothetical protein [Candidatus Firestonebacteria bacterium]
MLNFIFKNKPIYIILFILILLNIVKTDALEINSVQEKNNIITAIKVNGLKNHGDEVVLRTISIRKGDFVSFSIIRSDINKLYKLGFFNDIQVDALQSAEGIIITFIVKENPILHNVEFIGNENLKKSEIEEELDKMPSLSKLRSGMGYYADMEKATLERLIDFYRTKGLP